MASIAATGQAVLEVEQQLDYLGVGVLTRRVCFDLQDTVTMTGVMLFVTTASK